jgi:hypothetical protein
LRLDSGAALLAQVALGHLSGAVGVTGAIRHIERARRELAIVLGELDLAASR